jgi:hypothetical protein
MYGPSFFAMAVSYMCKIFMKSTLGACTIKLFKAVSGKPFQPSLMFVGEARSIPQRGAPEKFFTQVSSGLTSKH